MSDNHVSITITADSVSPTRQGFGLAAFLSYAAAADEIYTSQAAVVSAFGVDSPEAAFATAVFSQNPRPDSVLIARGTLPPTKRYSLTVETVRNSHKYQIGVRGKGLIPTTVEYTSDANATDAEIVSGLVAALNLVTGKNFTAAGTASPFTVTADNPGDYFTLEILDRTDLRMVQDHVDPGVATDLAALKLRRDDWYWLYTAWNSSAYAEAAAVWAQANGKVYVADVSDTAAATDASTGSADALDVLANTGYTRVAGFWTHREYEMPGARWVGNLAPRTPGSWTGKFKQLIGASDPSLTPTERANLIARHANFIETERGVKIVAEGTTSAGPNVIGGFLDETVSLDWQIDDISASVFAAEAGADKIPRTDQGMVVLQGALEGSLGRGVSRGIIADLTAEQNGGVPSPNVVVPLVSEMDDLLPRGVRMAFSFKLAGAVHKGTITGVVER